MEENSLPNPVAIVAVILMAVTLYLALHAPQFDAAPLYSQPLPTMQPTRTLIVPTPAPTIQVVYERGPVTNLVINQDVNVNVCVGMCR